MYPSDHIWKNIRTELHGYQAWPALTFISLFIITALTISTLLNNHPVKYVVKPLPVTTTLVQTVPQASPVKAPMRKTASAASQPTGYLEQMAPQQLTADAFAVPANITQKKSADIAAISVPDQLVLAQVKALPKETAVAEPHKPNSHIITQTQPTTIPAPVETKDETTKAALPDNAVSKPTVDNIRLLASGDDYEFSGNRSHRDYTDAFLQEFGFLPIHSGNRQQNTKLGFQVYVTPSTSYRNLSDAKVKQVVQSAAVVSNNILPVSNNNVNQVVQHRPALGLEAGFAILYKMTDRLKFKTGLQLNIRQYYIETFQSSTTDIATVSLINYRGVETVSFFSQYNNTTGVRKAQLDNKLYQLAIPLGVQWDMIQGKHFGINTEASVQPTFTINNSTYILSTDYKHYTSGNDFIRKWNLNTSLGLNLSYTDGLNSWQIGPQVRYQHLPTYSNSYPIQEHLVDYGIRLGFTRQIR